MEREISISHGGEPAVNRDQVVSGRLWWLSYRAPVVYAAAGRRTEVPSAHRTNQDSRQLDDRDPTRQIWSKATATYDLHYPTDQHVTISLLPVAPNQPERHTHLQRVARCVQLVDGGGGLC